METSVTTSTGSSSGSATKLPPTSSKLISKNNLELISKNNLTKEISSAVVVPSNNNNNKTTQDIGNVVLDDTNKEVKNTLSGERIHGLPNETLTGKYTRHQHYM